MIGAEFLEKAACKPPDSIRLMLSCYTELQSLTDAINRGALWKFFTKSWEDDLLRGNVRQAFEQYELRSERDRLAEELRLADAQFAGQVNLKDRELEFQHHLLERSREVLELLPAGVMGVGDDGAIALANRCAHRLLGRRGKYPPGPGGTGGAAAGSAVALQTGRP